MSHNLYVNGFSQSGAEHLAAILNLTYPGRNMITTNMLSEQFQNSMAYIVHTLGQDPDAIFLIAIREPVECLEAAILLESEGPKRIPIEISMDMLVKLYNTFHWELLDRDRVVLIPLSEMLLSPNALIDRLEPILGYSNDERAKLSDSEYLESISTELANSWELRSITKSYGWNDRYLEPISQQLNSGEYSNRLHLLNDLYTVLLSKALKG